MINLCKRARKAASKRKKDRIFAVFLQGADGLYASVCFRGSHAEAQEEYARLIEYIMQNDLAINGHSLEITLIDNGFTNDTSKFVTEISIPIVKK